MAWNTQRAEQTEVATSQHHLKVLKLKLFNLSNQELRLNEWKTEKIHELFIALLNEKRAHVDSCGRRSSNRVMTIDIVSKRPPATNLLPPIMVLLKPAVFPTCQKITCQKDFGTPKAHFLINRPTIKADL